MANFYTNHMAGTIAQRAVSKAPGGLANIKHAMTIQAQL